MLKVQQWINWGKLNRSQFDVKFHSQQKTSQTLTQFSSSLSWKAYVSLSQNETIIDETILDDTKSATSL